MLFTNTQVVRGVFVVVVSAWLGLSGKFAYAENEIQLVAAPGEIQNFIKQILPNHPRFIAAQAELDSVKANLNAADKAIYNPELELDTEKTNINTSYIGLSQTIDWGDQRGAKTQIATNQLDASKANFQSERQLLVRDLLMALSDYQNTTRLADLSNQRLKLMKDFYSVARQKYAAGDINQVELDLAQLAYNETVLKNAQVLAEQVDAEQSFYAIYGITPTNKKRLLPDLSVDFQAVNIPANLDAFVMTLPQMRLVRANVEASKNLIALRESESSADPTIAIRGGKEDTESLAGLTLTIPLNIRNNFSAEIDAARKDYLQAEHLAQLAYRNLRGNITSRTRQYQLTRKAWKQWLATGKVSMNRQLKLLKRLWQAGDLSTTDYLVQIKQNLDTHSAGIELQTTLWSSWLNWLDTTAQIESWLQLNNTRNK
ncbi:hypothetical protein MNBD_GAMMA21-1803 [hydrothermal vent metagenome]|uniref:Heavy metal RND efflux outer membrane protein, CzcC family n=1 Tax=hydrothermal vent metagenome TaxID=652676 RepID=A0A3B0ZRL3_9ZZZZ